MINQPEGLYSNQNEEISSKEREAIAKVCNIITALANHKIQIDEQVIIMMLDASKDYEATDMLSPKIQNQLVKQVVKQIQIL